MYLLYWETFSKVFLGSCDVISKGIWETIKQNDDLVTWWHSLKEIGCKGTEKMVVFRV